MNRPSPSFEHNRANPANAPDRDTVRWASYIPIVFVGLLGVLATWHAFQEVNGWEQQRVLQEFKNNAIDRVLMIQREIEITQGIVQDVGRLFDASQWVGRRDFRKFVDPTLKHHESIIALQWIPRVKDEDRSAFVRDASRTFSRFRITEYSPEGELIRAGKRPIHYPVLYVQPYRLNKDALGLDLAADPAILDELQVAMDTGQMQISSRIPLTPQDPDEFGFAIRLAVYTSEDSNEGEIEDIEDETLITADQRRSTLRGFVTGIFRISTIVEQALGNLRPIGIDIVISEISGNSTKDYLYRHASRKRKEHTDADSIPTASVNNNITYRQTINVLNRQWEIECSAIPSYYQPDSWHGWAILAVGLAFTILLTVYLLTLLESATKVRRLVAERTTQLMNANQALSNEIKVRIRTEQELQTLNETLEERVALRTAEAEKHVRELEQFAYVTSHDLKAPLRGIANLATWLQEDLKNNLTTATSEQLDLLRDRVQRMHGLVEGLLEYSRIGQTERSIEKVAVAELLNEVIDSISPPSGFIIEVAPDMPVLHTERLQIYQVFSNLIGNAIKHHKTEQGHVRVKAVDLGQSYEFSVADDGPGIAPEYHDKVFKMFQTLEARDLGSNTGIGLALVKKIIQDHDGSITLESEEGKGATFRFTWPKTG
jgi:signal transduction histidine kinase